MSTPDQVDEKQVIEIMRQRFPREFEIAVQQAYISNLQSALAGKDAENVDDE